MKSSTNIKIGGSEVSRTAHACAFFHTHEEYYNVLVPFIKDGIEGGEKAFHILDACYHTDHVERIEKSGVNTAEALKSEQLVIKDWSESYLKDGHFSQEAMVDLLESVLKDSNSKGYKSARLIGDMDWACKHEFEGVKNVVEYETRLNFVLPKYEGVVVVCTYDLNKHSATVIMDVLRTHPFVLIGGMMHANPYYASPEEFLNELSQRQ